MPFVKGQSGNRAGKKPGTKNRKTLLREELEKDGSALAAAIKEAALEGDGTAMSLWLSRLEPPLRPRAEKVQFDLDPSKPLHLQAQQVLVAVANGDIDPETGQMLVNLISSFAGIRHVDDLLVRIEALEQHRK
jgi:hypothetical protein